MADLMRPISYISVTTHRENECSRDWFDPPLVVMNGFGRLIVLVPNSQLCQVAGIDSFGNWTVLGRWFTIELGTG